MITRTYMNTKSMRICNNMRVRNGENRFGIKYTYAEETFDRYCVYPVALARVY